MFDVDTVTLVIGWLPKAAAFFTTIEGGEITMTFQGLSVHEYNGFATVSPTPGPQCAQYGPGVRTMAYTYSKRTGLKYKFGVVNGALNPYYPDDFAGTGMTLYGERVTLENCFDHQHYFINNPTADMYALKPVRVTD